MLDLYKKDILVFNTSDRYLAQQYCKNDAVMSCYPNFNNECNIYCYAGLIIIKKTEKSLLLIKEWLALCENYHFLDRTPSFIHRDLPYYIGNDCDNGLFNLCLSKHKIYPDETNLYMQNGMQAVHALSFNDYKKLDWSLLDSYPFQNRRDKIAKD